MSGWTVHVAQSGEAEELGLVHVTVWRQAYAGLMPAAYLAGLDPVAFADRWRARLEDPSWPSRTWVARDDEGICGIVTAGPGRDADCPTVEELYAVNMLERAHGTGIADALLARAIGDRPSYLWVLEGNARARAFYRRHGFADEGGRKPEPATGVVEIRMARGSVATP